MRRRDKDKQLPLFEAAAKDDNEEKAPVVIEPETQPAPALIVEQPPPVNTLPAIRLEVYLRLCGRKWDQVAGFRHWALARKLEPRTVPEWKNTHAEFDARPV